MRGDPPHSAIDSSSNQKSTPHARGSTAGEASYTDLPTSTPHARGSTVLFAYDLCLLCVYPACAGIHPSTRSRSISGLRLPRMRGDPPSAVSLYCPGSMSTPHARGSTRFFAFDVPGAYVYPACAGIHLYSAWDRREEKGLPRMRGDPPLRLCLQPCSVASTPHARGSTFQRLMSLPDEPVYPACAGIHRRFSCRTLCPVCLPRMRGDPPKAWRSPYSTKASTPHARGSTWRHARLCCPVAVYPACAGIHPAVPLGATGSKCLPRMRGDPPSKG